jgi:hypothetical protein
MLTLKDPKLRSISMKEVLIREFWKRLSLEPVTASTSPAQH